MAKFFSKVAAGDRFGRISVVRRHGTIGHNSDGGGCRMKTSEALRKARAQIEDPAHWNKGHYAVDENGVVCGLSSAAEKYCAVGAILRVHVIEGCACDYREAVQALAYCITDRSVAFMDYADCIEVVAKENDEGTHESILAVYDRAIARRIAAEALMWGAE